MPSAAHTVAPDQQGSDAAPTRARARRKLWFFTALAVATGVLGAGLWSSSRDHVSPQIRSGSPGYRQTKDGQNVRWERQPLTIYLDDSLTRISPQAGDAIIQAFGQWAQSDPRLPALAFDTGATTAIPAYDGKSTISFGRIKQPGHERDLAITVTYSDEATGKIVEADIVVNNIYPVGVLTPKARGGDHDHDHDHDRDHDHDHDSGSRKTVGQDEAEDCRDRYDLQNVATHEVGHFFGLGEDMVEEQATMFRSTDQCETHKRVLSPTDVTAVSTLYLTAEDPEEAAAGPPSCSFAVGENGGLARWAPGALVGLLLLRRRRSRTC